VRKQAEKRQKQEDEASDALTKAEYKSIVKKLNEENYPIDPSAKEQYFLSHITEAEQLLQQGIDSVGGQ
jgi:MAS20 protein import receptor